MDEVSLGAATLVGELKNGEITEYEIHPEDFGLPMASNRAFKVETPQESLALIRQVLDNHPGAARDVVLLNTGAALYAANVAADIRDGIAKARVALESGAARAKVDELVRVAKTLGAE
jgi:anthranilate phosphoribosyltransferase